MTSYKFEGMDPSFGSDSDVNNDLDAFTDRLRQDPASTPEYNEVSTPEPPKPEIASDDKELLRTYVIANHRAADWYGKARDKRRTSRERYAWGRIVLLALLPIGVFFLSFFKDQAGLTQATVLLTGLMAAFRASSEWMETKYAASNFAKAASELKEKIYSFELKWKGKAFTVNTGNPTLTLTPKCRIALEVGIVQAREIARNQREAYFTASAPPSIDIMKALDKARTDVTALIKNYQSPELTKALKDEQGEKATQLTRNLLLSEITKLTTLINARSQLISEKERELPAAEADAGRKDALKAFIATLRKSQEGTETTLINKTSALAAL